MKKRTKEEAIEKDPVVNDLKVPNEVQRENRKVHCNGSITLFVHSKLSTSAALAKTKKKNSRQKEGNVRKS